MLQSRQYLWQARISFLCFLIHSCNQNESKGFYERGNPAYIVNYIKQNQYPNKIDTLVNNFILKDCDSSILYKKAVYFEQHIYKNNSKKDSVFIDSSIYLVDAIGCNNKKWRMKLNKQLKLIYYEELKQ